MITMKLFLNTILIALLCCWSRVGWFCNAKPLATFGGDDIMSNLASKYEVYVPDRNGQMSQQMMTLPEIRALLARQSTEGLQNYNDKTGVLSIEGGKGVDGMDRPTGAVYDVVSSVRTIVASEMANQNYPAQDEDVFVIMATGDQMAAQQHSVVNVDSQVIDATLPAAEHANDAEQNHHDSLSVGDGSESENNAASVDRLEGHSTRRDDSTTENPNGTDHAEGAEQHSTPKIETQTEDVSVGEAEASTMSPDERTTTQTTLNSANDFDETKVEDVLTITNGAEHDEETLPAVENHNHDRVDAQEMYHDLDSEQHGEAQEVQQVVEENVESHGVAVEGDRVDDAHVHGEHGEKLENVEVDAGNDHVELGVMHAEEKVGEDPLEEHLPAEDKAGGHGQHAGGDHVELDVMHAKISEEPREEHLPVEDIAADHEPEAVKYHAEHDHKQEEERINDDQVPDRMNDENTARDHGNHHDEHDDGHHGDHHDGYHGEHHDGHHGEHHEGHHGEHHDDHHGEHHDGHHHHHHDFNQAAFEPLPVDNPGLLSTSERQDPELGNLTTASNTIGWKIWNDIVNDRSIESNQAFSPLALTSALGISFLGARGSTAESIDSALHLDSFSSRNPHLHLHSVAHDLEPNEYFDSLQSHTVYLDENKGPVKDIFHARLNTLYGGTIARNEKQLYLQIRNTKTNVPSDPISPDFSDEQMKLNSPFGILSVAKLNVAWPSSLASDDNVTEEYLQFLNLPSAAQVSGRRLVPVPTVIANGTYYAGYDPTMDATTVALPLYPVHDGREESYFSTAPSANTTESLAVAGHLSLVLVMPGHASKFKAGGSGLADLENRLALHPDGWDSLLRNTVPRNLYVQFPQLSSHNRLNLGQFMKQGLGSSSGSSVKLDRLFDRSGADFTGISSSKPLYLVDVAQIVELNINSVSSQSVGDESEEIRSDKYRSGGPVYKANSRKGVVKATTKVPPQPPSPVYPEEEIMTLETPTPIKVASSKKPASSATSNVSRSASKNYASVKVASKSTVDKSGTNKKTKSTAQLTTATKTAENAPKTKPTPKTKQQAVEQKSVTKSTTTKTNNSTKAKTTPPTKSKDPTSKSRQPTGLKSESSPNLAIFKGKESTAVKTVNKAKTNSKTTTAKPKADANSKPKQSSTPKPKPPTSKPVSSTNTKQSTKSKSGVPATRAQVNKPKASTATTPKTSATAEPKTIPASKSKTPTAIKPKTKSTTAKPKTTAASKSKTLAATKPKTTSITEKPKTTTASKSKTPTTTKPTASATTKPKTVLANKSKTLTTTKPKTTTPIKSKTRTTTKPTTSATAKRKTDNVSTKETFIARPQPSAPAKSKQPIDESKSDLVNRAVTVQSKPLTTPKPSLSNALKVKTTTSPRSKTPTTTLKSVSKPGSKTNKQAPVNPKTASQVPKTTPKPKRPVTNKPKQSPAVTPRSGTKPCVKNVGSNSKLKSESQTTVKPKQVGKTNPPKPSSTLKPVAGSKSTNATRNAVTVKPVVAKGKQKEILSSQATTKRPIVNNKNGKGTTLKPPTTASPSFKKQVAAVTKRPTPTSSPVTRKVPVRPNTNTERRIPPVAQKTATNKNSNISKLPKTTTTMRPTSQKTTQKTNQKTTNKPNVVTGKAKLTKTVKNDTLTAVNNAQLKSNLKSKSQAQDVMVEVVATPVVNRNPSAKVKSTNRTTGKNCPLKRSRLSDDDIQHLSFNRAFLYAVRHNPTGLLIMIGRYVHP